MRRILLVFCSIAIGFGGGLYARQEAKEGGSLTAEQPQKAPPKKSNVRPPSSTSAKAEPFEGASVERMKGQCVTLETDVGQMEIEVLPEAAPETVRNFLNLSATGFYNTTTFHRVVKGFMIQGGNAASRQTLTDALIRRSLQRIPDEPNYILHERGIVSMARAESLNSATTNFFILVGAAHHLDGKFAAFGRVVRGMDVVDAINNAPVEGEKPEKPVQVRRAVVAACAPPAQPQ